MRFTFASCLRAGCVATALILGSAYGAEQSLVGASRDQVLARYGEPRSVMAAGGREILFFASERVVLRNGVVIEVEKLPVEPPARSAAPKAAPASPAEATTAATPAAPGAPGAAPTTPAPATTEATAAPAQTPAPSSAEPAPAVKAARPEPTISIKSVRPPTGTYVRPPLKKAEPPAPEPAPAASVTAQSPASVETKPSVPAPQPATTVAQPEPAPAPAAPKSASAEDAAAPESSATAPQSQATVAPAVADRPAVAEAPSTAANGKAVTPDAPSKAIPQGTERVPSDELQPPPAPQPMFSQQTYVIGIVVIVLGTALLFWRLRQRQLELAASAVSHNPFSAQPIAAATGKRFTQEYLSKLNADQFAELVAAYYGKTGVVAERPKGASGGPAQIKIAWKGETRPFALVLCIGQPQGLVDAKPLDELCSALTAEDIRRGYVVTSGKFNVAARDFAEEKHLTLMPGDIFLEKLNALPDSARAELMQEVQPAEAAASESS